MITEEEVREAYDILVKIGKLEESRHKLREASEPGKGTVTLTACLFRARREELYTPDDSAPFLALAEKEISEKLSPLRERLSKLGVAESPTPTEADDGR